MSENDKIARKLALAVVVWINGNDENGDLYEEVERLSKQWQELIVEGQVIIHEN